MLELTERGALDHFDVESTQLASAAELVIRSIRSNYPDLAIPYHSRWRHFETGGVDRWSGLSAPLERTPEERARVAIELAVVSVLLDAGAGARWVYKEPLTGLRLARSEGLAIASLDLYAAGALSGDDASPLRADAQVLESFTSERLAIAFQVSDANPLAGVDGRAALLERLGATLRARPDVFGERRPRVGALYDFLADKARGRQLPATVILSTVLDTFSDIWPSRIRLDGQNLGDVWRHSAITANDASATLVPFHKLSQWLSYSLIEPLEDTGMVVTQVDGLTGLAEYRNGGLFVDCGVLVPKHPRVTAEPHPPDSEIIVEWRALTVALLDRVAALVRQKLGLDTETLPLAKILQGGTWSAGRAIAKERRRDGSPPITIISDGTVF